MDYSPVVLRFIRSESKKEEDHLLRIKRNQNEYLWTYTEQKSKKVQYMEFKDGGAVLSAMERMFHLLSWDIDAYESIQVDAPGFPMVLLEMSDLNKSWQVLRPFLEGIFENWPVNTTWELVEENDDDLANPEIDARDEATVESDSNDGCCRCDGTLEEGEVSESDDKTDPDMPSLVSENETPTQELLRLMRQLQLNQRNSVESNVNESSWLEAAEERQRQDPITIRRLVNTPNGVRTHMRFI